MVCSLGGALGRHLVVLPEEGWQSQLLEVVFQQQCRLVVHDALRDSRSHIVCGRGLAHAYSRKVRVQLQVETGGRPSMLHSARCLTASKLMAPSLMASLSAE